ncbi:hypothetical protein JXB41_03005 [Candidatus Woesearchaeota archaeon]|nr:hypothetical protein [Candidatus Woesearchaeota archaeon]
MTISKMSLVKTVLSIIALAVAFTGCIPPPAESPKVSKVSLDDCLKKETSEAVSACVVKNGYVPYVLEDNEYAPYMLDGTPVILSEALAPGMRYYYVPTDGTIEIPYEAIGVYAGVAGRLTLIGSLVVYNSRADEYGLYSQLYGDGNWWIFQNWAKNYEWEAAQVKASVSEGTGARALGSGATGDFNYQPSPNFDKCNFYGADGTLTKSPEPVSIINQEAFFPTDSTIPGTSLSYYSAEQFNNHEVRPIPLLSKVQTDGTEVFYVLEGHKRLADAMHQGVKVIDAIVIRAEDFDPEGIMSVTELYTQLAFCVNGEGSGRLLSWDSKGRKPQWYPEAVITASGMNSDAGSTYFYPTGRFNMGSYIAEVLDESY